MNSRTARPLPPLLRRPLTQLAVLATAVGAVVLTVTTGASGLVTGPRAADTVAVAPRSAQATSTGAVIARLAPGAAFRDAAGALWESDTSLVQGGKLPRRSSRNIIGTTDDALYQGERYGNFTYRIPVPAVGNYHVQINEAELVFRHAGQRVFSVAAEGVTKRSGVDVTKAAGGPLRPLSISFDTRVSDGVLTLRFSSAVNYSRISSLLVTRAPASGTTAQAPASTPTPTSGAPKPVTAAASRWGSPLEGDPTAPIDGIFGPRSVWSTPISSAPVADNSSALIGNLTAQVNAYYSGIAGFNVWQYNSSTYTVGPDQARVTLKYDDCQGKGHTPSQLYGDDGWFVNVPIPSDAVPSAGTDASLGIYQPSTDTYWGFWKLKKKSDGWHACWGGRVDHTSTSRGWYEDGGGVSATGLADGGFIGIKEAQAGHIDHAIGISIPSPAHWKRWSWPALRSDGSDPSPTAIPEGTRLRLDPRIDVDALSLTPLAKMVAKAAQKYGFIVTDKAGCVGIGTESGAGVEAVTGTNPWTALLGDVPSYLVLRNFPWDRLQALPQHYGKS